MDDIKRASGHNTPLGEDANSNEVVDNPVDPKIDISIDEANIDEAIDSKDVEQLSGPSSSKVSFKTRLKDWFTFHWPPKKKEYITLVVVILLIASGIVLVGSGNKTKQPPKADLAKVKTVKVSDLVPSTLSGLPVAPSVNKIPVTAVMIENSDDARPQSGLSQASIVFEALTEGGVSRFMALYQDTAPSNVGPIRSLRPYYLQWALGFDASIAHVGGSPEALSDLQSWGGKDLDEFYNGSYYHRITSREAPHNVYTSIADLNQLEAAKGFNSVNFTSFPRKTAAPAKVPTATNISLVLSGPDFNVNYVYDSATNSYNRSEGGTAMIDANNNDQISPKVVIAIVVPESQGTLDASGAYYSDYSVVGSGQAFVFQDGTEVSGQWSKSSNTTQLSFTDANGQVIKLDPGQTWITAVTDASAVTYSQ